MSFLHTRLLRGIPDAHRRELTERYSPASKPDELNASIVRSLRKPLVPPVPAVHEAPRPVHARPPGTGRLRKPQS